MNTTITEYEECKLLVGYLELLKMQGKVVVFSHTANETYTKSWKQKRKNKEMGVRSGVPDYIIVTPKKVLFIEMKRTKGGVISDTQKKWVSALEATKTACKVCYGFDEAKLFLDEQCRR